MNLHHLQYFQAIANLQSFTKASEMLFVSQPTLSYAVSSLEKELGVILLVRGTRSAILTEDGQLFLDYVNTALKELENGIQALHDHAAPSVHSIRIITARTMTVISEINHFRNCYDASGIEFSLKKSVHGNIEDQLVAGECDIAFQAKQPVKAGIEYTQLPDKKMVLLVPPNHPLATRDSIDLREVDWSQRVVVRKRRSNDARNYQIDSIYKQIGFDTSNASSCAESTLGLACMVEAGFGIGIVPELDHIVDFAVKAIPITYPETCAVFYMMRLRGIPAFSAANRLFCFIMEKYGIKEPISV